MRFTGRATIGLAAAVALTQGAVAQGVRGTGPGVLTPRRLAACERLPATFGRTGEIVNMLRAYRGQDGQSAIEEVPLRGTSAVFYGGKVSLTQYPLGDPTAAVVVYGHPNITIPPHKSPYREIFLILSGSSVVELANGKRFELTPGTMLLSEDQDTPGRGGRAGPCGYVALDLQFKAPAP